MLLVPFLYFLGYWIMRLVGLPVSESWHIPPSTPLILVAFFVAAAGEELGYMGYAVDRMQTRWGALTTALLMGAFWALWHVPSMIQVGQTPPLIIWGLLGTIAFRVLYVWIYNNSGRSVFATTLFHAVANTARTIFPGGRSDYELADGSVSYSLVIATALVVILLWGPKTLSGAPFNNKKSVQKESQDAS